MKKILLLTILFLPFSNCRAEAALCGPLLVANSALVFGNYSSASTSNTTAIATITVSCTVLALTSLPNFTVALSSGATAGFNPRQMIYLTSMLNYNLYTNSSYTTVWGDGSSSTSIQSYSVSNGPSSTSFTVYGSIPKAQSSAAGIYTDTIIATITY